MKIDICDRYQLQKQISQKAGRSTYLALDDRSQNLVIIKILQVDNLFQWDDFKLFEREANTLKNISHPNIPQYLDYFEIEDENFCGFALVQTYINAPSLETAIIKGRKFSEVELIELATKILDILTYLHQQNPPVIHRDIKPSNILLTDRTGNSVGNVYLVDFGSVQTVASKDNGTITIVGSYGYIPLEQFGGQTTTVSDLYSLGMTLIYLVTGVHPAELPQVNGKVQFDSNNISNSFAKWLEKMTKPYPDKRYKSALVAKNALQLQDENLESFLELKPKNTKIKLKRDRDLLQITYPLSSNNINLPLYGFYTLLLGFFFLFLLPIYSINAFVILFFLGVFAFLFLTDLISLDKITLQLYGFLCLISGFLTSTFIPLNKTFFLLCFFLLLFCLFVGSIMVINDISTYITQKLFELCKTISIRKNSVINERIHRRKKEKVSLKNQTAFYDIDLIIYSPSYTFNKRSDSKNNLNALKIPAQLRLIAGNNEYVIQNDNFTEKEYLWLGKEISDFLNIKLEIMYASPQVRDKSN